MIRSGDGGRKNIFRFVIVACIGIGGFAVSTTGVFASLQAQSSNSGNPLSSQSGILALVLSPNPASVGASNGLGLATVSSPVIPVQSGTTSWRLGNTDGVTAKAVKPGDTIYRFINVYLSGAVNATGLTMQVADLANGGAGSALSQCNATTVNGTTCGATGTVPGLQVTIDHCNVATGWVSVTSAPGTCGNNTTDIVNVSPVSYLKALIAATTNLNASAPNPFTTMVSNSATADNSTAVARLRFKFFLPLAPTESVQNGTIPTTNTIQNQTSAIKVTFATTQRNPISVAS